MLKAINPLTRAIIIGLVIVNAVLGAFLYLYLQGAADSKAQELRRTTSQINSVQTDISDIQDQIQDMNERGDEFENFQAAGFFDQQDRAPLEQAFRQVRRVSDVSSFRYRIEAATCYTNETLRDSDYVILGSPMEITVEADTDLSIYNFIDLFKQTLSGYPALERLHIEKTQPLTAEVLKQIGTGNPSGLMEGFVDMTWYTIVSKEEVTCN